MKPVCDHMIVYALLASRNTATWTHSSKRLCLYPATQYNRFLITLNNMMLLLGDVAYAN